MKSLADYLPKKDSLRETCPVRAALDVIRGRWKASILFELCKEGVRRFSDLQAAMPEIRAQVLTVQLRELEAEGVIIRKVYAEVPARVEYSLSAHGARLSAVMDQLEEWGRSHLKRQE